MAGGVCSGTAGTFESLEVMAADDVRSCMAHGLDVKPFADRPGVLTADCSRYRVAEYGVMIDFAFNIKAGMKAISDPPAFSDDNIIRQ